MSILIQIQRVLRSLKEKALIGLIVCITYLLIYSYLELVIISKLIKKVYSIIPK
jgi:hypothetical protein